MNLIQPDLSLPTVLPAQKATQFRLASAASTTIKDIGFTGEMGYQNLLYPVEADLRRLLSFLVERVPRSTDRSELLGSTLLLTPSAQITSALSSFISQRRTILTAIPTRTSTTASSSAMNAPVSPFGFLSHSLCYPTKHASMEEIEYYRAYQPSLSLQNQPSSSTPRTVSASTLADSIFEHIALSAVDDTLRMARNASDTSTSSVASNRETIRASFASALRTATLSTAASSGSRKARSTTAPTTSALALGASNFARRTGFSQEGETTVPGLSRADLDAQEREEAERLEAERAAELAALQAELDQATALAAERAKVTAAAEKALKTLATEQATADKQATEAEAALKVRRRVLDLLPEAEANARKLQQLADDAVARLVALGQEWELVRNTLLMAYRTAKLARADKRAVFETKTKALKDSREELRARVAEAKERDEALRAVVEELNSLPKTVSRQVFIRRITDIVRNLDRQRSEIQRILVDVRSIQRELNAKEESVRRSFDVADDLVYQAAKVQKDPTAVQVYRSVVELRQGFAAIVEAIEKTGKSSNDANELQQKIDALEARLSGLSMDTVSDDLAQMRAENKTLKSEIKKVHMQ